MELIQKTEAYCRQFELLAPGDRVIAGFSGGADSICLLSVLCRYRKMAGIQVTAVHLHHGIRGASADRDAAFCEKICREWDIPLRIFRRDIPEIADREKLTLEEAGRRERYALFEQVRAEEGADRIAVAHHKSDQAETILMNLARGSGLRGISGIQPKRGCIVRPLLGVSRAEIEAYLRAQQIPWCEDETNASMEYTRNYVRKELIPGMEQHLNGQVVEHLLQAAELAGEADRYLESEAAAFYRKQADESEERIALDRDALLKLPRILQSYVLQIALKKICQTEKDLTMVHRNMLLELLVRPGNREADLPYGIHAVAGYRLLELKKKTYMEPDGDAEDKSGSSKFYAVYSVVPYQKSKKIPQNTCINWFDYDKIKEIVSLRTRKPGDRICVLAPDGRKKLKDYMIDARIPKEERAQIPLLAAGCDILWVFGWRMSEAYKVTDETKWILQVEIKEGGNEHGR